MSNLVLLKWKSPVLQQLETGLTLTGGGQITESGQGAGVMSGG